MDRFRITERNSKNEIVADETFALGGWSVGAGGTYHEPSGLTLRFDKRVEGKGGYDETIEIEVSADVLEAILPSILRVAGQQKIDLKLSDIVGRL